MKQTDIDAARAAFAPRGMGDADPELARLYDSKRAWYADSESVRKQIDAKERLVKGYRKNFPQRVAKIDAQLLDLHEQMNVIRAELDKRDAQISEINAQREQAKRAVLDVLVLDVLDDYGRVINNEFDRPSHVEFKRDIDGQSIDLAIVVRGEFSFEVGWRSNDDKRYFLFGYDIDTNAPDIGYRSTDGSVQSRRPATVNWGSIGATAPHDARVFAALLDIAAGVAMRVNELLGFTEGDA
jgi:hypothetical protein